MRLRKLQAVWTQGPFDFEFRQRMLRELDGWRGTRYASGQRCRGELADCIGFVFGAIDGFDGRERAQAPSMPADIALHDPETSMAALLALRQLYDPIITVQGNQAQPFDILVVGPRGAGPSHAMLVGPLPGTIWHCTPGSGVHQAGWCLGTGYESLHGIYRIGDRERWFQ